MSSSKPDIISTDKHKITEANIFVTTVSSFNDCYKQKDKVQIHPDKYLLKSLVRTRFT